MSSVGSAALCGARTFIATDAKPKINPAAAAATIVQREPVRRDRGAADSGPFVCATNGASLGGGDDSITATPMLESVRMFALVFALVPACTLVRLVPAPRASRVPGRAIVRSVICSLALSGAGSTLAGGGGGTLERASGMCSDSGTSPTRTTTACRGGAFNPGRAMKPPRGVWASRENAGSESGDFSSSYESVLLIGRLASTFAVGRG